MNLLNYIENKKNESTCLKKVQMVHLKIFYLCFLLLAESILKKGVKKENHSQRLRW